MIEIQGIMTYVQTPKHFRVEFFNRLENSNFLQLGVDMGVMATTL
jgi:hypothetical protein